MLKYLAIVFLAFAPCGIVAAEPDENQTVIHARMLALAGSGAEQCGLIAAGASYQEAWECAQRADRSQKPFWLAVEGHRTDSAVWHIVARAPDGKRSVIFYTSNNYGRPEFEPYFGLTECHEPFELFGSLQFMLRCGPDVP